MSFHVFSIFYSIASVLYLLFTGCNLPYRHRTLRQLKLNAVSDSWPGSVSLSSVRIRHRDLSLTLSSLWPHRRGSWWMSWWWQLAIWQAGNGSRFLIAPNRMWACKLLTWDARRAEGLGKSPGGCGGRGGEGGGGGAAGWEEGTGRDLVISGTVSVSLADRRKKKCVCCVFFAMYDELVHSFIFPHQQTWLFLLLGWFFLLSPKKKQLCLLQWKIKEDWGNHHPYLSSLYIKSLLWQPWNNILCATGVKVTGSYRICFLKVTAAQS